ncbi:hypothetical protein EMCRGX_G012346 [Ephydatia muelleri]
MPRKARILTRKARILTRKARILTKEGKNLDQEGKILTKKARILTRKARILTKKARILTRKARILTRKARILTKKARILTRKARILTKNARILTKNARILTKKARILTSKARILTKKARILTKKARILTKKARILTKKARILTKKARILPKNKNLAAIILDLGQDLGQDPQESGQDLRKDTHEFRQDLGKMKFKILSCHKILPKNLAQEFFAGRAILHMEQEDTDRNIYYIECSIFRYCSVGLDQKLQIKGHKVKLKLIVKHSPVVMADNGSPVYTHTFTGLVSDALYTVSVLLQLPQQKPPAFETILGLSGEVTVMSKAAVSLTPQLDTRISAGLVLSSLLPKPHPASRRAVNQFAATLSLYALEEDLHLRQVAALEEYSMGYGLSEHLGTSDL